MQCDCVRENKSRNSSIDKDGGDHGDLDLLIIANVTEINITLSAFNI